MKLNYFGCFSGNIGYSVAARGLVGGLIRNGNNVTAIPDQKFTSREEMDEIRPALKEAEEIESEVPAFIHTVPRGLELAKAHGSSRYCYSVLETSLIPDDWVRNLNACDGAITATKWGKAIYEECGVNNVSVVPHGVDSMMFSPYNQKIKELVDAKKFFFLTVGKFEERKGYDVLFEAFNQEFKDEEDVEILAHMNNPFIREFNAAEALMSMNLSSYKKIRPVPNMPRAKMASLYATCDAFVAPTRGEGWGLPITEAMASAMPTIVTNWSGPTEYATKDNAFLLNKFELKEPSLGLQFHDSFEGSQWANPDVAELREAMRAVYENRDEARKKGDQARKDMVAKWSWERAAETLVGVMG